MKADYDAALAWQQEQDLACSGCGMPRDKWWVFDPEHQHELIEQAKAMTGSRLCATCYARDVDQERYREGKGDMRGRHWTIEHPE